PASNPHSIKPSLARQADYCRAIATFNVAYMCVPGKPSCTRYRNGFPRLMSSPAPKSMFAKRLKEGRLALGISQRELGRRIGLSEDVVSSRVTRYERGTS